MDNEELYFDLMSIYQIIENLIYIDQKKRKTPTDQELIKREHLNLLRQVEHLFKVNNIPLPYQEEPQQSVPIPIRPTTWGDIVFKTRDRYNSNNN